jgi:c-di-GMP-binding flagellar brake protein YcgR
MGERRRHVRVQVDDSLVLSLGGSHYNVSAALTDISLGGAFFYSERFLAEGSELAFMVVFPPGTMASKWLRALCRARVLRANKQPVAGKFGTAVRFLNVQTLP